MFPLWLRKPVTGQSDHPRRRRPLKPAHRSRLSVERLEDRIQPAITWNPAAPLPLQRYEAPSATVDGLMYVFSGQGPITPRVDVYNPVTNSWTQLSDMPYAVNHAGVAVDGQTVYLAGGYAGDLFPGVVTNRVLRYDVPTDTWSEILPLPEPRGAGGLVRLGRELHFFGGLDDVEGAPVTDRGEHWVLNLDSGTEWTSAAPLPNPRNHFGYVELNGLAYAIGGEHLFSHADPQDAVHAYDPVTDAWTEVASLPFPRGHQHTSTFVVNGQIVTAGGAIGLRFLTDVTAYDPATNTWTELTPLPEPRIAAATAQYVNDRIVLAGGLLEEDQISAMTWIGVEMPPNQPPVLDPLPDQTIPAGQDVLVVPLSATDPDGDPLTLTAAAQSLAYLLDQELGLEFLDDYYEDWLGQGEKWVVDGAGQWYFLLPNGELYQWDGGDGATGALVGVPGASYHANPGLLHDALADTPYAALTIGEDGLTIDREDGFVGSLVVTVMASDGSLTDSKTFTVIVSA